MVSKARLDFPLPLGPVTTVIFPSGRSRLIPLRLFWRAPRISIEPHSVSTVRDDFSAIFEPTGDYPVDHCSTQISDGTAQANRAGSARARAASLRLETLRQFLALFEQFVWDNSA